MEACLKVASEQAVSRLDKPWAVVQQQMAGPVESQDSRNEGQLSSEWRTGELRLRGILLGDPEGSISATVAPAWCRFACRTDAMPIFHAHMLDEAEQVMVKKALQSGIMQLATNRPIQESNSMVNRTVNGILGASGSSWLLPITWS